MSSFSHPSDSPRSAHTEARSKVPSLHPPQPAKTPEASWPCSLLQVLVGGMQPISDVVTRFLVPEAASGWHCLAEHVLTKSHPFLHMHAYSHIHPYTLSHTLICTHSDFHFCPKMKESGMSYFCLFFFSSGHARSKRKFPKPGIEPVPQL